jgi:hypothetical protein
VGCFLQGDPSADGTAWLDALLGDALSGDAPLAAAAAPVLS